MMARFLPFLLAATFAHATEDPVEMIGAFRFSEGLATVVVDGKHGYINTQGELVIPAIYSSASGMTNGFAMVAHENVLRYIDRNGTLLNEQPAAFALPSRFHEGLTQFADNAPPSEQRHGYLDLNGNVAIPATFQHASDFAEGLASVARDQRYYFIDRSGERAFPGDFFFAFDFSEGLAAVNVDPAQNQNLGAVISGSWGFVDKSGVLVIPAVYQEARPFEEGFARIKQDGNWGAISHQGAIVVASRYSETQEISEGLMAVMQSVDNQAKWGFVNMSGELVIPPRFDQVRPFSEGFAMVSIDGKRGYIDHTGAYLWNPSQ